jgi:sulfite reductase (NADPH) flavoprotein alpha-component
MVKVNILWASMFGTAEDVANDVHEKVKDNGVEIFEMNDVSMEDFQAMENVVFVSSTTGQGDVPTNGDNFYSELEKAELDLSKTKYAVCALGDSSHTNFCGAGKKIDARMEALGATRIADRLECDGDDEGAREYSEDSIAKLIG